MLKQAEARRMALKELSTPTPINLFANPVEYLVAVHYRLRALCQLLDEVAMAATFEEAALEVIIWFLQTEMPPHILDEEEDLFPLLRRRAEPEDEIHTLLGQLSMEHTAGELDAALIVVLLEKLKSSSDNSEINEDTVQLLNRFAANERQHLIVENAIVLPLARVRLTDIDQQQLGQKMAARRGVVLDG
ncbi:MAG: hemerythrin domain-containing protein [Rhizobiaceae bacterium]